ncbi:MAG: hypothetical protein MZW92_32620 [Comamonadaceae bacterium]|nr:hypothetical protein [Comamonadaceae bacterium]
MASTLYSGIYDNLFMTLKILDNNTIYYLTPNKYYYLDKLEIVSENFNAEAFLNGEKRLIGENTLDEKSPQIQLQQPQQELLSTIIESVQKRDSAV